VSTRRSRNSSIVVIKIIGEKKWRRRKNKRERRRKNKRERRRELTFCDVCLKYFEE
jgi:predicted aminopeptidase